MSNVLVRIATEGPTVEMNDTGEARYIKSLQDPTPVDGSEGIWRHIEAASPACLGMPMMLTWDVDDRPNGNADVLATITPPVTKIAPTDAGRQALRTGDAQAKVIQLDRMNGKVIAQRDDAEAADWLDAKDAKKKAMLN